MDMDIKIFVSHRIDKKAKCINNSLFTNIRCGAYFDKDESDLIGDNTGDNISSKRLSYCELTVQYWAWKNIEADYYGFCHYRRFLSFAERTFPENAVGVVEYPKIDETAIERYHLDEASMRSEIEKYDIITNKAIPVKKSGNFKSVYDYCKKSPYAYIASDIDVLREIINEKHPESLDDFNAFFDGDENRWYNCYIMKKDVFHNYAAWLFDILFEFERRIDVSQYTQEQLRVFGVMAERLWGVYLLKVQREGKYSVCEKQLVYFQDTSESREYLEPQKDKIVVAIPIEENTITLAYSSILNLLKNADNSRKIKIVLLHNDLEKKIKPILSTQQKFENAEIQEFNTSQIIRKYRIIQPNIAYGTDFLYFSVLDVFRKFEKVIFMTPFVNALADIAELYDMPMGNSYGAAPMDALALSICYSQKAMKKYIIDTLGQKEPFSYYNFNICILNVSEIVKKYIATSFIKMINIRSYTRPFFDIMNAKLSGKIRRLSTEWGVIADNNNFIHEQTRWYLPYKLYNDFVETYKTPKMVCFSGLSYPWNNMKMDFSELFWGSIRGTTLYDQAMEIFDINKGIETTLQIIASTESRISDNRTGARKIADKLMPPNTLRRQLAKFLVPRDSPQWKLFKQIYFLIRPEYRPKKPVKTEEDQ